jgi:SsrA-binding protein
MKISNRKAYYDFEIGEKFEAGIKLSGGEVKSVKEGHVSLVDSFVRIVGNDALLLNCHIHPYRFANNRDYDSKQTRKLLLHKKEIVSLQSKLKQSNQTIVPVSIYQKGDIIKIELALARGKKQWDKKKALREKSMQRDEEEEMRREKK